MAGSGFLRVDNLYFAYGSNMLTERMQTRIASAEPLGHACLNGYAWRCNKLGRDGTAKANLIRSSSERVHGVLYRVAATVWPQLDQFEPDYQRITVPISYSGQTKDAFTYLSDLLTSRAADQTYLECIISGATMHGLPSAYIEQIMELTKRIKSG